MEYYLMEPPLEFEDFSKLKRKEAKVLFDWFTSNIEERVNLLKMLYAWDGFDKSDLDYSLESLDKVWAWFVGLINLYTHQILKRDIPKGKLPQKGAFIYDFMNYSNLCILLTAISTDIGIYLGETFIKHNPSAKWDFVSKPKDATFVNKPAISNFKFGGEKVMYDVVSVVYNLSLYYSEGNGRDNELSRSFKRWEKRLIIN